MVAARCPVYGLESSAVGCAEEYANGTICQPSIPYLYACLVRVDEGWQEVNKQTNKQTNNKQWGHIYLFWLKNISVPFPFFFVCGYAGGSDYRVGRACGVKDDARGIPV